MCFNKSLNKASKLNYRKVIIIKNKNIEIIILMRCLMG